MAFCKRESLYRGSPGCANHIVHSCQQFDSTLLSVEIYFSPAAKYCIKTSRNVKFNELFFSDARGMALVSLGNILQRTGYLKNASVVVNASIHFLKDKRISWFTLGNIYAVSMISAYVMIRLPSLLMILPFLA